MTVLMALGFAAAPIRAQVNTGATVETGSFGAVTTASMPGTVSGGNIVFDGTGVLSSVAFTAGNTKFDGKLVDFHGKEAAFLSGGYEGSVAIPNVAGPASVSAQVSFQSKGGANAVWAGMKLIRLTAGFSASSLALAAGTSLKYDISSSNWSSADVPELNDASNVGVAGTATVTSVDPVNGIVTLNGGVSVQANPKVVAPVDNMTAGVGIGMVVIGLLGQAALRARRRGAKR
ncbi:MAG TPA: hypothetical protein VKE69_11675 [Planctomycetota bacterium]|nr:hypothetical protein [Planctomycetota bacterium]